MLGKLYLPPLSYHYLHLVPKLSNNYGTYLILKLIYPRELIAQRIREPSEITAKNRYSLLFCLTIWGPFDQHLLQRYDRYYFQLNRD